MAAPNPAMRKIVNVYVCPYHEDFYITFPNEPTTEQGGCCALHSTPCYRCPCDWGLICQFFISVDIITALDEENQPITAGTVIRNFVRFYGNTNVDATLSSIFSMNYSRPEQNELIAKIRTHISAQQFPTMA